MKPKLSHAATQLRDQINDCFPERDRASDGWIADIRHMRSGKPSDHIPDKNWVRAIDIDADLLGKSKPEIMPDLADEIRALQSAMQRKGLPTSSLTDGLHLRFSDGNGESTQGLTNTSSMLTSALRRRLTKIVLFFRYLC